MVLCEHLMGRKVSLFYYPTRTGILSSEHLELLEIPAKLIYCKRHVFSCQTVDKSATIISVSDAKALPRAGKLKFDCQNFEF